jgi:hypothetical protein
MEDEKPDAPANTKNSVAASKTGGWIQNGNNILTVFTAVVTTFGLVLTTINKKNIDDLNLRNQRQKDSQEYVDTFMNEVIKDPLLSGSGAGVAGKTLQAKLSLCNIIAQASADQKGESDAKSRALVPLELALLFGQPGAIAAIDSDFQFTDDWLGFALSDGNDSTRVTAIEAMAGMSQSALRLKKLSKVERCWDAIGQLMNAIPADENALVKVKDDVGSVDQESLDQIALKAQAISAQAHLALFISRDSQLLSSGTVDDATQENAADVVATLKTEAASAIEDALNLDAKLRTANTALARVNNGSGTDRAVASKQSASDAGNASKLKSLTAALDSLDQVLQTTAGATPVTLISNPVVAGTGGANSAVLATSGTSGNQGQTAPIVIGAAGVSGTSVIKVLLAEAETSTGSAQDAAFSSLALAGQDAVKDLIDLEYREWKAHSPDGLAIPGNPITEGVAKTLNRMSQPIVLDGSDAYWVCQLLQCDDSTVRTNASDFLMNLESEDSLKNCFDSVEVMFSNSIGNPDKNGSTVINIATVMGTWARVITPDTPSRVLGKSFRELALEEATTWQQWLTKIDPKNWAHTIQTLNELIAKAAPQGNGA